MKIGAYTLAVSTPNIEASSSGHISPEQYKAVCRILERGDLPSRWVSDALREAPAEESSGVGCYDCGLQYGGASWIEAVIPDKAWNLPRMTPEQVSARAKEFARKCKSAAADADQPEHGPAGWMVSREGDRSFPKVVATRAEAACWEQHVALHPLVTVSPLYPASVKAERDALHAENAELRERVEGLESVFRKMTGIPASIGICEPIEGYSQRPSDALRAMEVMAKRIAAMQEGKS